MKHLRKNQEVCRGEKDVPRVLSGVVTLYSDSLEEHFYPPIKREEGLWALLECKCTGEVYGPVSQQGGCSWIQVLGYGMWSVWAVPPLQITHFSYFVSAHGMC